MITRFAIAHPVAVLVLVLAVVTSGLVSYITLPREAAPDIKIPNIIVSVPYFGVSPDDIETLVTNPLERELKEIKDVDELTSTSAEGAAMVNVQFSPDLETSEALQRVRDAVGRAKPDLPADAEEPIISEISISDFPILLVFISGDYGLVRLRQVADDLSERIEAIDGVLGARVNGGLEREVQVQIDPFRLQHYDLTLGDVSKAISAENVNLPGGSVDEGDIRYLLRVPAEIEAVNELNAVVVKTLEGQPIRLAQIATVVDGFEEVSTHSRIRGVPGISLGVTKRARANLPKIVDEVKRIVGERASTFPSGTRVTYLADASKDIRMMVRELENNILSGLVLVLLVLFLFLGGRNSLFVAASIPLSMLITFLVLTMLDITLNMIVLFSLILALGMLVDNAIVIVENIYRHAQLGKGRVEAALTGTQEVAWPVITSTVTTLCAFGPLLMWPGIMGDFMGYLPQTLIITLSASLFVALVVNPVLCALFMDVESRPEERKEATIIRLYRRTLDVALSHRWITALASFGILIGTMAAYGALGAGTEFFPDVTPRKAFISVRAPDGTNVGASDRIVRDIEALLKPLTNVLEYVADVGGGAGQSGLFSGAGGATNQSRVTVDFQEPEDRTENPYDTIDGLRRGVAAAVAGAEVRIERQNMGPPSGAPINIEVAGEDYGHLAQAADRIQREIKTVPGLTDLRDNYNEGRPELRVELDRALANQLGLKSTRAVGVVRTAVHGRVASKYREFDEEYDIVVRLAPEFRESLPHIAGLAVDGDKGKRIPLGVVAQLSTSTGSGSIRHIDRKRVVTVSSDVEGRNANEALADVRKRLDGFDAGAATLSFTGENKEQAKAQAFLSKALFAALALIALVIVTQFNSVLQLAIIMASVLLSLIGVLWGLIFTQTPFGIIMTGIGVISLAGVVVNNAIVLIDYVNQLRREGHSVREAVREGGAVRLRPVLLTAVTTILGLVPMATGYGVDFLAMKLQIGGQSAEWWSPMAIAVIFGLAAATILTLIVVPVFYDILMDLHGRVSARLQLSRPLRVLTFVASTAFVILFVAGVVSGTVAAQ